MISTARLLLRPFSLADVPKVFAMSREEGLRRWLPDQVYRDQPHAELVIRALMGHTENRPDPATRPWVLAIEHEEPRELIGHVGLSPARGSVEIGYAVEQRWQGHGFATEAVAAMSQWATTTLSVSEILGIVGADNKPSCRVLEKAGYVRHGDAVTKAEGAAPIVIYRYTPALQSG